MYSSIDIPYWKILVLALMVAFAITLLPLLVRLLPFFTKNKKLKKKTARIGAFVHRLFWGLIVFFALVVGLNMNIVFGSLFALLILIAGRFYVFNYIAGLAMYFSDEFGEYNREIYDRKLNGRINKIGVFYSEIEQSEGQLFYIENTQLRVLKIKRTTQASDSHTVTIHYKVPNDKSINLLKEDLNDRLLNNPFVKLDHPIKIEVDEVKDDFIVFSISLNVDDDQAIDQIRKLLDAH